MDTHIHLEEVEGDLDDILAEARAAGVTDMIAMGVDGPTSRRVAGWSDAKPGVWAAVGHHPLNQEPPDLDLLRELAQRPRVVAVGEVGLDHADEHRGPHDAQEEWFDGCCALALDLGLPVCVHTRECTEAVYAAIRRHPGITGVMHYWVLDWEWAKRFLDLGFFISFSGVVTRSSRDALREVARRVPADRLLVETDAPWGTPKGREGRMRPAWMVDTARVLADVRGISLEQLADLEWANVRRLFPRLAPHGAR
ncbi:MAG TPA: TatD family hydrolase, partial [Candidatus Dormibacteraeota bacterium]|nr:TatD family hydrolase [Candidatus Dormibacteraeota bacterium]